MMQEFGALEERDPAMLIEHSATRHAVTLDGFLGASGIGRRTAHKFALGTISRAILRGDLIGGSRVIQSDDRYPNLAANPSARPWSRLTAATRSISGSVTIAGAIVLWTMWPIPMTRQRSFFIGSETEEGGRVLGQDCLLLPR
jgi:hypothetical protein